MQYMPVRNTRPSALWVASSLPALVFAQAEDPASQIVPPAGVTETAPAVQAGQTTATFNDGLYTPDTVQAAATIPQSTTAVPEEIVTTTSVEEQTEAVPTTSTVVSPSTTSTTLLTSTAQTSSSPSSASSSSSSSAQSSSRASSSISQSSATIASAEASVEPGNPVGKPFKVVLPLIIIGSVIALFTICGFIWHRRRKNRINKRISGFHRKQRSMMPPGWDEDERDDDEKSSFTGLHVSDDGHSANAAAWGTPQRQMSEKQVDRAFEQAYDAPDQFIPPTNAAGFGTQSISNRELKDERGWGWGTNRSKNHKQASIISKGSSKFRAKRSDTISQHPSGPDLDAMLAESRTGYTSNDAAQYEQENAPGMLSRTATMVYNTLSSQISRRSRMHQRLTDDHDDSYDEYGQKLDYGEEDAAEVIDLRYEGNGYSHVRSQTETGTPGRPLPMPPSTPTRAPSTPTRARAPHIQAPASVQKMDSQISRSVKRWTLADERAPGSPSSQYSTPVAPLNYHHAPPTSLTPGTRNALNSSVGPLSPPLQPHFFYHGASAPAKQQESDSIAGIASRFLPANNAPPSPVEDPFGPSYTSMPAKRERRQSIIGQDMNASPVRRSAAKMVSSLSQPAHSTAPESPSRRRADSLMDGQRRSAMRSPAQRQREEEQAARSVSRIVREGREGKTTPVKERIRLLREQQSRDFLQAAKRNSLMHE